MEAKPGLCLGFIPGLFRRFLCILLFDSKENFKVSFEASVSLRGVRLDLVCHLSMSSYVVSEMYERYLLRFSSSGTALVWQTAREHQQQRSSNGGGF